jgi:hypothetical protein
MDSRDFYKAIADRQFEEREAIKSFVQGAVRGDLELFSLGIELVENHCVWRRAFRAVAKHSAPVDLRTRFAGAWMISGDHIRCEVGDDLVLINALRALLPSYVGNPVRLYRGDSAWNRRCRTYGLSWTTNINVARSFARGIWRTYEGGSVVVTTMATADAIISVMGAEDDHYEEEEYLVDRRRLKVDIVERLSQITLDQHSAQSVAVREELERKE